MLARAATLVRRSQTMGVSRQSRTFLTPSYWMKRAKILHIVGRMIVAYPQMNGIPDPDAPINQLFARDKSERERAFMFVLSQMAPDEPIELAEFLRGAKDAAFGILPLIFDGTHEDILETLALPECVAIWKHRNSQLRELVGASKTATMRLETLQVKHAGVSEVNYSYADAKREDEDEDEGEEDPKSAKKETQKTIEADTRPPSMFHMHEAIQIKVQFDVREIVRVVEPDTNTTTLPSDHAIAVDSSFEWTFASDVSRAEYVDWVITSVSGFTSTFAPNDHSVEKIVNDIQKTL